MKKALLLLVVAVLFVSAVPTTLAQETPRKWWSDTTWYLLFVRSFYDSDGDGIGDLRGVIEKLDYLNDGDPNTTTDLGITGIWLMPIFEAQSYHGYDALDYRAIEQDYGTEDDFRDLMDAAHERGIKIIVDMVLNHTSSQHEWFTASINADPTYNDWFIWEDTNPAYKGPWGETAWYKKDDRYYYAVFWSEMPDLNYENPSVTVEMQDVAGFWLDEMGVDGFRLDAIKYVIEDEIEGRMILENAPANRAWLADYNAYVKSQNPDALTIGEIWDGTSVIKRYINEGSVDMAFEFEFAEDMISTAISGNSKTVMNKMKFLLRDYPEGTWASFLTNHDQPRLLTLLKDDVGANRVVATIMMTAPGAPFIYYGEEIGMVGNKPDELIRTPMQWDSTPVTGGFTTGTPWQPLTPDFENVTVANETDDSDSLLSFYRDLIRLRNNNSAFVSGSTEVATVKGTKVYSILRQDENGTFLVVVNVDNRAVTNYDITLENVIFTSLTSATVLFGAGEVALPSLSADGTIEAYVPKAELAPYETLIIKLF